MSEKSLEQKVNDIHVAIVGNKEYGQKGLNERVGDLEEHKRSNWKMHLKTGSIGGIIGVGLAALSQKVGLAKVIGWLI